MKLLVPLFFLLSLPALAEPVTIVDGDTWKSGGTTIRLHGIDAPELRQVCIRDRMPWKAGQEAKSWLQRYLRGRHVECFPTGSKSYGRIVADCYMDGENVQEVIVRNGWAFDAPRYSGGKYEAAERAAERDGLGIWQAQCQTPAEWRKLN